MTFTIFEVSNNIIYNYTAMGNSKIPKKKYKQRYPVIYMEGAIPIRSINVVSIYLPEMVMGKIAKIANQHELSVAKILAISGQPCACCKGQMVSVIHKGNAIEIPKGLLYLPKQASGTPISKTKK
jgi:hypothetical protein